MTDNSVAESLLIVSWTTNHGAPKTESLQATQFNRDMFVQPLPWDAVSDERGNLKVVEANPWFVAFPGELPAVGRAGGRVGPLIPGAGGRQTAEIMASEEIAAPTPVTQNGPRAIGVAVNGSRSPMRRGRALGVQAS